MDKRVFWILACCVALLALALALHMMADPAPVPLHEPMPTGKPISELCCPQGAVPLCWCAQANAVPRPPCDPGYLSGTIPGVDGDVCYSIGMP